MNEYKLTTKSGEVIAKIKVDTMELAVAVFARMKQISESDLLEIYKIKEC